MGTPDPHVSRRFRAVTLLAAAAVAASVFVAVQPAAADSAPTDPTVPATVTADALPTVQIDGVVWSQAVTGGNVYATGSFATARPAGSAAGVNTVNRGNLLSYNITTGVLNANFNPYLNADGQIVVASPDGSRIYVGGDFSTAGGQTHNRLAAYNTATGAIISSFAPQFNARVRSIVVTNSGIYVGGSFTAVGGVTRNRLAEVSPVDGSLMAWNPSADDAEVDSMVLAPAGNKVIVGGKFTTIGGQPAYGLAAIDVNTGGLLPWAAGSALRNDSVNTVQDAGVNAALDTLTTDGTLIYGAGYVFGDGGNLEGVFAADAVTGNLVWVDDCHGDTYSVYATATDIYAVGHTHFCGDIGGFPQTNPWTFYRSMAFTKTVAGVSTPDPYGYHNWAGVPAPGILDWFPTFNTGTYTGQNQAAWSVTGDGTYVVEGGEFTTVNGKAQQGLVRFVTANKAPNLIGPTSISNPSVVSLSAGTARVAWKATFDRDNAALTYKVVRNGATATPVYTTTVNSTFWQEPNIGFVDTGLTPGKSYSYRLYVSDAFGNSTSSGSTTVTVSATGTTSAYSSAVLADGASPYYPLGESSGTTAYDYSGFNDAVVGTGVTRGDPGPIASNGNTASIFDGDSSGNGLVATQSAIPGPNTFALEAWFKTTSTSGGKIIGFGSQNTGLSSSYDRHVYMDAAGHVYFGVYDGNTETVQSSNTYNDGTWHQVVANLSSTGMQLYVDGVRVGARSDITQGQAFTGYWRIGGDSSWNGANYFTGDISNVAIYPAPLTLQQVNNHYVLSGRPSAIKPAPSDAYGAAVYNASPDLYWRLDDTGTSTAADSSLSGTATGTYTGGVTQGVAGALGTSSDQAASFDGSSGGVYSNTQYSNPTTYSEEIWFKTTTQVGGKLIGFGSSQTGGSGSYDRHVYMQNDGTLVFGAYTGQLNEATSTSSYNDGKWHYAVATEGSNGMNLYVDGALVGSNPNTGAQSYSGYWRVGGDTTWSSSSAYFNGYLDEAAVYSSVLTPAQILNHYQLGVGTVPNVPPVAAFTSTVSGLTANFDGSTSTDSDGTVNSYAWNFGDGSTGTGQTPTHTYLLAGTYTASLTVTDNSGAPSTPVTHTVTVAVPNVPPVAAFTSTVSGLTANFDGSTSTDSDGTVNSYAWNFGDGSTGTGQTPTHTYLLAGTYTASLTVTDNSGAPSTPVTHTVTVAVPNVPPVAAFTSTVSGLTANFDGSTSTDSDGTVNSYAWNFGDGSTGTGQTPTHTYLLAGTYTASLTVTDNSGAPSTPVTHTVTVAVPNVPPVAAFTSTVSGLTANFDGSTSTDSDGTVNSYAWNFGDGSTGTGQTPTHTYLLAGTYTASLTVTDNSGAPSTPVTHTVTVAVPNVPPVAAFTSTVSGLTANFDGSTSTDSDGTVNSYAWNFGDGSTGTGQTPTHTYLLAGTYTASLTVTDNSGAPSTPVTHTVTVAGTSAAFATDAFGRTVANGWGTADLGGVWTTVGTASNLNVSSGAANFVLPTVGSTARAYLGSTLVSSADIRVQLSADKVGTGGGTYVYVVGRRIASTTEYRARVKFAPGNKIGVSLSALEGSSTETSLASEIILPGTFAAGSKVDVRLQVTGTNPTTVQVKVWADGTAEPTAWTLTASDSTAALQAPGALSMAAYLSANSTNAPITVSYYNLTATPVGGTVPNVPPVAAFTSTVSGLTANFDGSTSTDSDGTVNSYAWNFGDGSTGTGQTPTHTYLLAGTYTASLTVTDNSGAPSTPVTHTVTVAGTSAAFATDAFGRTVANGWGTADLGGVWTTVGTASNLNVSSGAANFVLPTVGSTARAYLGSTLVSSADIRVQLSADKVGTGGGTYVYVVGRRIASTTEYRARVKFAPGNKIGVSLSALEGSSTETSLASEIILPGTFAAGSKVDVRLQVTGTNPTTVQVKVWADGTAEPTAWTLTASDSTAALQAPGALSMAAYLSANSTNAPITVSYYNLTATPVQ